MCGVPALRRLLHVAGGRQRLAPAECLFHRPAGRWAPWLTRPPTLDPLSSCPLPSTLAAYIMTAFAALLQAGLMRAQALAEAHEAFTLTPLLIGGALECPLALRGVLERLGDQGASSAAARHRCSRGRALVLGGKQLAHRLAAICQPARSLAPPSPTVGCQLFLCWLLYFYTASAMRESVLKVNGSHIRPWWVAWACLQAAGAGGLQLWPRTSGPMRWVPGHGEQLAPCPPTLHLRSLCSHSLPAGLPACFFPCPFPLQRRSLTGGSTITTCSIGTAMLRLSLSPVSTPISLPHRWIHHHYWSIGTAMLMLSLPVDSPSVARSVQTFLWWAILQGAVIVMQNR